MLIIWKYKVVSINFKLKKNQAMRDINLANFLLGNNLISSEKNLNMVLKR